MITDLGLPDMPGQQFCAIVRTRWPSSAIVFATGMDKGPTLADTSRTALLRKPFGLEELRKAIGVVTKS
jgi:DNA-binding response OmpR family regulator